MFNRCLPLLTGCLATATAITALPADAEQWTFVVAADDDSLWFAGRVRRVDDLAIVHVKVTDDPEHEDYDYHQAINCKTKKYKVKNGWKLIDPNQIIDSFYLHACKSNQSSAKQSSLKGQLSDTPFQF